MIDLGGKVANNYYQIIFEFPGMICYNSLSKYKV